MLCYSFAMNNIDFSIPQTSSSVDDCLCGISLLLENSRELHAVDIPTQVAPCLNRAAALESPEPSLGHMHALCLSWLFDKHGMPNRAVQYMCGILDHTFAKTVGQYDTNTALIWLAWLYICDLQNNIGVIVLDSVLSALPDHCTTSLEGVIYNMRAIALRRVGDLKQAAENLHASFDVCEEFEDRKNWAIALANFGFLSLQVNATRVAEEYFTDAIELFSELDNDGHELSFVTVLLELGKLYISQGLSKNGQMCYECALLIAILYENPDCKY